MRTPLASTLRQHPWALRIGLAFALAVALGYGPHRAAGGTSARIDRLGEQLEQTRDAIEATARENERLRERVRALKDDPRAVEEIARRDLGLVKPGEVVIELGRASRDERAAEVR